MATLYFNTETNRVFSANAVTGDEAVSQGRAVKVTDAPDGIEQWRLTYDPSTKAVVTYAEGKDEAGAQKDKEDAAVAQAADDKKKEEDLIASRSA
tara:strand:+ start:1313 stop:1597 length:285 start_codon:yes stop_codon:yes gene_type:complete